MWKKIRLWINKIKIFLLKLIPIKIKSGCGHWNSLAVTVEAFEEKRNFTYKLKRLFSSHKNLYCPQCLANMAIKCGWCDNVIWPGDEITLLKPKNIDSYKLPESALLYSQNPVVVVGCVCDADAVIDVQGNWHPPEGILFKDSIIHKLEKNPNQVLIAEV